MRIRKMLLGALTVLSSSVFAFAVQVDTCQLNVTTATAIQQGGLYITASGTVHILCVYVQFPDDNWQPSNSNWPKGQAPTYMNSTVEPVWTSSPAAGGITDYFNKMSFNALKITGNEVSVITPHTRGWYLANNKKRKDIQREVIEQLDATIDFAQYDNWRFDSDYVQTNSADGIVDMIFMMWRNISSDTVDVRSALDLIPGGEASLGYDDDFTVDGGARTIKMGYEDAAGSGITAIHPVGGNLNSEIIWKYAEHEFSHWLLGGNDYHTTGGGWGMLNNTGVGNCANAFERERLGWINLDATTIINFSPARTITVTLSDFVTTGEAYRIKVPVPGGGGNVSYFLVENHQRSSAFDVPDVNYPNAKGLYILRQSNETTGGIIVTSAEGKFKWDVVAMSPNIYGSTPTMLPVFKRGISKNRLNGYSRRNSIPYSFSGYSSGQMPILYELINSDTVKAPPSVVEGTGRDQFDLTYAPVFTPESNPSTDINSYPDKFGIKVTSYNSGTGVYTFNIHINTTEQTAPSKPQEVTAAINSSNQITVGWKANEESDVTSGGGYNVYREVYYGTSTVQNIKLNSSLVTATTYIDNNNSLPSGIPSGVDLYCRYKVEAVDNTAKVSVKSDAGVIYLGRTVTGTIGQSNLTWDGKYVVVGNLMLNSGSTITIKPGSVIRFPANISLTMSGKLTASGTATSPIYFISLSGSGTTGSWGSIILNNSGASTSKISNAVIKYATQIQANYVPSFVIDSVTIDTTIYAVLTYGSNGWITNSNINYPRDHGIMAHSGSTIACYHNKLKKTDHSGAGIYYIYNSGDYMYHNDISGFNWGVGILYEAYPFFGHSTNYGHPNNRITNCLNGLHIYGDSYPTIRHYISWWTDGNSIFNNINYNVVLYSNSPAIYADRVFWDYNSPPNPAKFSLDGDFYYNPWSTTNSWEGIPLLKSGSENSPIASSSNDKLREGIELRGKGKHAEAVRYFKSLIKEEPKKVETYIELFKTYNDTTSGNILDIFASLPNESPVAAKFLRSSLLLKAGEIDEAKKINNALITENPDSKISTRSKLNNFYISLYDENNPNEAEKILNEVMSKPELSTDMELSLAKHSLRTFVPAELEDRRQLRKQILNGVQTIPTRFALYQNYPNPFNPSTKIQYQVPNAGVVTLKIFDVLGREIATLVNEQKQPGNYHVQWNASAVSSGFYFYRMHAGKFVETKRMVFLK